MRADSRHMNLASISLSIWKHLSRRRRIQVVLLFILMLVNSVTESISLAMLLPFLAVIVAPEQFSSNPLMVSVASALGLKLDHSLLSESFGIALGVAFVVAVAISGLIRLLVIWITIHVGAKVASEFGAEAYRRALSQPYRFHIDQNSSELIAAITNKIGRVINGGLFPVLALFSGVITICALLSTLLIIDFGRIVILGGFLLGAYVVIAVASNAVLKRNSVRIAREQTRVLKALQEGIGSIRDVLLGGYQDWYAKAYADSDRALQRALGLNSFIAQSPRVFIEVLGIAVLVAVALLIVSSDRSAAVVIPVLGTLVLGAQRLLPAFQQVYHSIVTIRGNAASIYDGLAFLDLTIVERMNDPVPFFNAVEFYGVSYRYSSAGPWILRNVSLTIAKGRRIGVVGRSGAGKSTFLDILMGLLAPSRGALLVDDQEISSSNIASWQRQIAHVPQHVFLCDASISENIAFGVEPATIDMDRVRRAAKQAQLLDFIESIPEGFATVIGERGARLSGGQRQRIGIARALYRDASILVLDEATSALDESTERALLTNLFRSLPEITIVLVTHRLNMVKTCDLVLELKNGELSSESRA